jgi:Peptidase family M28
MQQHLFGAALAWALLTSAPTVEAAPKFDASRSWQYLKTQVEFGSRAPGSEGHAACLAWMQKELGGLADRLSVHSFEYDDPYGEGDLALTNLRAIFRPEATTRLALAAHWDTRPFADRDPDSPEDPLLGANDGGSGVAVLLEIARQLAETPAPIGVDLLFFDGEDYGREGEPDHYLIGSRRFVADHPQYRPRALILLDMVGDKHLRIPYERYSATASPQLVQAVFERARALGLPAFQPVLGMAILDDHVPFLQAGIEAVDLIDFDYPQWHTLADDLEACSPRSLEQVGILLLSLVYDGLGY